MAADGREGPVVVDASALVVVLAGLPGGDEVLAAMRDRPLHAPELLDAEVLQAVRRLEGSGALSPGDAIVALERLPEVKLTRWRHLALLEAAWSLRDNLTAYDALYVALARRLRAPILTCDKRLARAPALQVPVLLVQC